MARLYRENRALLAMYTVVALFSLALFGVTGLRFMLGLGLMVAPVYLVLQRAGFSTPESVVFGLFLSIGLLPTITYYSGLLFGSLYAGLIISYCVFWGAAVYAVMRMPARTGPRH